VGGKQFLWSWIEPKGQSGGILLGINPSVFDIGYISQGDYHIKFRMRNKADGFQWNLIAVYGAAQPEHKQSFLSELGYCQSKSLPVAIGGDFNIIRGPQDKNNDRYDDRWLFLFNTVINSLDLNKEIELSGLNFIWANNSLPKPTFERLDRVLVSTEWELNFPQATVQALTRYISSDHTPLLLTFGSSLGATQPMFKFELGWLTRDDFHNVVIQTWQQECRGNTSLERWQNKIRCLCQFLRGWAKNKSCHYKKKKKELISMLDQLDKKKI